jgi:hypothetical protein
MPEVFTYKVTRPDLPGWLPGSLANQRRGLGYTVDNYFVHLYGRDDGQWVVSPGLTVTEAANGTLIDWVTKTFGAEDVSQVALEAGGVVDGVWRPGLYYMDHVWQALGTDQQEQRAAEQSLHLLVAALNDLFLYVEPEGAGLDSYGPKTRELLILACTEIEDAWTRYLRRAGRAEGARGYSTNDYVSLLEPLHLADYEVGLVPFKRVPKTRPFAGWSSAAPTQSLVWYDAYNKTKHDRSRHLSSATVARCVEAVAANLALYCVRFSPHALFEQTTPLASLATHLFSVALVDVDPTTFYVPLIDPTSRPPSLTTGDSRNVTQPWKVLALSV